MIEDVAIGSVTEVTVGVGNFFIVEISTTIKAVNANFFIVWHLGLFVGIEIVFECGCNVWQNGIEL